MPLNFVAKAAITAGLMAANMALTMSRKIEGPRLDDLKSTGADYGTPLYMIWGMRRLEVPIFHAEDLKEVKRRRKTKGGKFNEYTYYGTWAVALAGHEIAAVRRIWFDTHLVYDVSGAGPVTPFDFGSNGGDISERIAIYLGTEDQEVDPRMQAYIEAKHGEGSCPAYRGTPYVMFKDVPLEKIGNRIPQVSVEVLSLAEDTFPSETLDTDYIGFARRFSPDFSRFAWFTNDGEYEIFDVAARQRMISGTFILDPALQDSFGVSNDGAIYYIAGDRDGLVKVEPDGTAGTELYTFGGDPYRQAEVRVLEDGNGDDHVVTLPFSFYSSVFVDGVRVDTADIVGTAFVPKCAFTDSYGDIWVAGCPNVYGTDTIYFMRVVTIGASPLPSTITATVSNPINDNPADLQAVHYAGNGADHFVVQAAADYMYIIDAATGAELFVTDPGSTNTNQIAQFSNMPPGASTIWLNSPTTAIEVSLADLSTVRTISFGAWGGANPSMVLYDPINHALLTNPTSVSSLRWLYLDRVGSPGIDLGDILAGVADMVGIVSYDFGALDQTITGWSATRGQASNMVEPLLDAYDSDIRPHDWTIQGVKRAGVSSGATLSRFVGDPRYSVKVRQASELPRALIIDFADVDADQQPNSKRASRPLDATDARGEQKLDLTTLALDVDEAAQLGERYFRRLWNERKQPMLSLTAQNLGLEPADVRTLEMDGTTVTARATRVLIKADETIETEWRYDNPSLATLDGSAGAGFDGRDPAVIAVPLISKGFVFDIPLLTDADEDASPLLYVAAGPHADGTWPGAVVYQATGGEYSDELASVPSSSPVTWGYVEEAMPYANPNLWDRGTELTVKLQTGELIGCTEAEANADPSLNLIAIGNMGRWELLQFTTAELVTGKTYTVSGFKRGRRGTEWAAELHQVSDQFVLLDTAQDEALGLSEVGTELSFKAITSGRTDGLPITLSDFEGNSLKPYAPCHLESVKDPSTGDWSFTWVRRTRVGGAWTSGTPIPLSEATEEYHLTVGDGVSSDIKTVTSPSYVWDVAEQTTDTGAEVMAGDLEYSVAQVSDAVGDGFLAEATA